MKRLKGSAETVGLPDFDEVEFLSLLKELIKVEEP
jgi:hypothetical protein